MKASEASYLHCEGISTGLSSLDKITGVGGIPLRRITEISGAFSVGKSTLALTVIAQAQTQKHPTLWVDAEFALDLAYAKSLDVDGSKLDLVAENTAEDNLDAVEEWLRSTKNGVCVIDSIGGLLPREEAEKGSGEKVIGGQAKLIAAFCRRIVPVLARNNNALIVLNHEFTDLMSGKLMTSGGAKLGYAKSLWLRLKKANKRIMQGEEQIGDVIEVEVRKNKLAPTLKQKCELQLFYGQGFSKTADLLQDALDKGIITKEGQSYFLGEEKLCRGLPALRELFKDETFLRRPELSPLQ